VEAVEGLGTKETLLGTQMLFQEMVVLVAVWVKEIAQRM
jgi:hypothetical protein